MRGLCFGDEFLHLGDRTCQISLKAQRARKPPSALARSELVTDGVGEIAAFLGCYAHSRGVTGNEGGLSLLGEDLDEPPLVADFASKDVGFGKVAPGHVDVVN